MPEGPRNGTVCASAPPTSGARHACLDWARAVGCVAVVALHVFVTLGSYVGYDALGPVRLFVEGSLSIALGRWAVPVFLMVSGALLLDPSKDLGWERVWRYVSRMLFVLGTFGLAFCLVESALAHGGLGGPQVLEALANLVTGNSWGHLWYVYALLAVYVLTPALRRVVASAERRSMTLAMVALYMVVLAIPTLAHLAQRTIGSPLNVAPALFYYLLGWYVWAYVRLDWLTVLFGCASLAAMVAAQVLGRGELALPEYCLVAPYGMLVFSLFRRYATAEMQEFPLAQALADLSFGIYVVHPVFLHAVARLVDPLSLPVGVFELVAFVVAMAGSVVTVRLIRHVPGFSGRV